MLRSHFWCSQSRVISKYCKEKLGNNGRFDSHEMTISQYRRRVSYKEFAMGQKTINFDIDIYVMEEYFLVKKLMLE